MKKVDRQKSMKLKGMTVLLSLILGTANVAGCVTNKKRTNDKESVSSTMVQNENEFINNSYKKSNYLKNLLLVNDGINDYLTSNNLQKEEKECNGVIYNDFKAKCHDDEELDRAISKIDGYSDSEEVDFENEYFFKKLFDKLKNNELEDYLSSLSIDQLYALAVYVHRNIYYNNLRISYENLYRKILSNALNINYSSFEDSDGSFLYIDSDKKLLNSTFEADRVVALARHYGIYVTESDLLYKLIKNAPDSNFMVREMAKSETFGDEDNIEKLYDDLYKSINMYNLVLHGYDNQKRKSLIKK